MGWEATRYLAQVRQVCVTLIYIDINIQILRTDPFCLYPHGVLIGSGHSFRSNAGMTSNTYRQAKNTGAPYELMYYTDILSHVQLTLSLLPSFTPNSRIVNVTSIAQYETTERIPATDLAWLERIEKSWGYRVGDKYTSEQSKQIYYRVKFLQVVFTSVNALLTFHLLS